MVAVFLKIFKVDFHKNTTNFVARFLLEWQQNLVRFMLTNLFLWSKEFFIENFNFRIFFKRRQIWKNAKKKVCSHFVKFYKQYLLRFQYILHRSRGKFKKLSFPNILRKIIKCIFHKISFACFRNSAWNIKSNLVENQTFFIEPNIFFFLILAYIKTAFGYFCAGQINFVTMKVLQMNKLVFLFCQIFCCFKEKISYVFLLEVLIKCLSYIKSYKGLKTEFVSFF